MQLERYVADLKTQILENTLALCIRSNCSFVLKASCQSLTHSVNQSISQSISQSVTELAIVVVGVHVFQYAEKLKHLHRPNIDKNPPGYRNKYTYNLTENS